MASSPTAVAAAERLRSSADIQAVFRARSSRAGRLLVVHGRRRDDAGSPRVAVIASRKVGGAVQRNRAKRVLREAARRTPWLPGIDVVLIARREAADAGMHEVAEELRRLAARLELREGDGAAPGRGAS